MTSTRRSLLRRVAVVLVAMAPMLAVGPIASALTTPNTSRYACVHLDIDPEIGLGLTNRR